MNKILICDDEIKIRETFRDYLSAKGFDITLAANGREAVQMVENDEFDLIILDVMMPVMNGLEACRLIRKITDTPILFLSALGEEKDILDGYKQGCDDYIVKPFPMAVLTEKCNAVINRYKGNALQKEISLYGITLDKSKMKVTVDGKEIDLSNKIFHLLALLMENKDIVLSREQILTKIWGWDFDGEKYYPVSITLDDQRNDVRKFTFSDLTITKTIDEDSVSMYYYFYDFYETSIDHAYYQIVKKELEETVANFEFDDFEGGSGSSGTGVTKWTSRYEDYAFFYLTKYNHFYEVITSDMFLTLTVFMAVLFAIVTVVILSVASTLYDKNRNLNEAKRAFTSAAAHELKTPLAVIQNQCECVIDNIAPEKNGEYIKSIYDEALRMNGIVQTLLTFNRLSDASGVHKEKCNLSEIVKAEVKKYEPFALQMRVTVTSEIEENIFVECNSELIAMAIDNYLSNAVKYAENEKNVKVVLRKEHKGFFFKVYNDCENVNLSSDVWELLTREDKARNSSDNSTGMGLPICRKIFNLHGYEHWFTQEGNGLSFIFKKNG